jgi:hypothetical protein
METKDLPSFQNKSKYIHPCETSHNKIKDPKMTRKKLKIPNFQNKKIKKNSKFTCPISSLVKLHTTKLKTPKMTRRKLKILELQNTKTKYTNFFEDPQNDKKKIKDFGTSKYRNKKHNFF